MKKRLVTALCSTLVVATALPALALTFDVTGFFRDRFMVANYTMKAENNKPDTFVDQRFRAKLTMGVNEYIKVVYFTEIDFQWGDARYANARNDGGGLGGDTVNLETKNLYVEAKIPNSPLTVTAGLQGFADNWDWVLFNADMSGLKFGIKTGNIDANLGWFKLFEESLGTSNGIGGSNNEDDVTLWAAQFSMMPTKAFKFGADLYWVKNDGIEAAQGPTANFMVVGDDTATENLYYFGVNASYKLPAVTLSGWALYNWGKMKDLEGGDLFVYRGSPWPIYTGEEDDVDVRAWAATVKADFAPAAGLTSMARVLYFSADSDLSDSTMKMVRNPFLSAENANFLRDGLMIFLPDGMGATYPAIPGYAMEDAAWAGYGLLGLVANASYTPPTMKQFYVKGAAGYFMSLRDKVKFDDDFDQERGGKNLGLEVAARVGYVFADKFDVSLNGAYAWLGNFYDKASRDSLIEGIVIDDDDGQDPDNPYVLYAMINVNF